MAATDQIRVLIVGCGIIGKHHATVLTRHPAFTVTALLDSDPSVAGAAAALVEAEGAARPSIFDSLAAALASDTVDLVAICTPSGLHVGQAEQVLAAGVHVVVEKPLDVSVELGRAFAELATASGERGQLVSVISQHRFDPANAAVREAVTDGRLGRITSAVASMAWYRSQQYYDQGDWRGTWALDGGGAVMNQGVHTVDLLRWFLGRPVEIFAHTAQLAHSRIEIEDTATATVRFESGALAVIHATTAAFPGLTTRIQVHGSAGSAIVNADQLEYFFSATDAERFGTHGFSAHAGAVVENNAADLVPAEHLTSAPKPPDNFIRGHARQYDDIAAALTDHRAPGVTVDEALLSLTLVRSLYLSATLGQPVLFDDVLDGKYDGVTTEVTAPTGSGAEGSRARGSKTGAATA
jgi:UDP-N-acetyl-2-amino-2-deoxyglucuronate dehydrogenase